MIEEAELLVLGGVPVANTFAEAFPVVGTRLILTAVSQEWAQIAAAEMCGYATSVISCDAEVAVEENLPPERTPDGRPGVSVLLFAFSKERLSTAVEGRVGQCVLTCPTTACYNGILDSPRESQIGLGSSLRYFGDGFQRSKKLDGRRFWRIPVMDGEFVCEDKCGSVEAVAGGNLLLCGANQQLALAAAATAVDAMRKVSGTALPFPGGIVRSGSKVGSKYKKLKASTNDAYCPTLIAQTQSVLPDGTGAVYEIVIDGLTYESVREAMRAGLHAASKCDGLRLITAGNYGGKLGKHHFHLRELIG